MQPLHADQAEQKPSGGFFGFGTGKVKAGAAKAEAEEEAEEEPKKVREAAPGVGVFMTYAPPCPLPRLRYSPRALRFPRLHGTLLSSTPRTRARRAAAFPPANRLPT